MIGVIAIKGVIFIFFHISVSLLSLGLFAAFFSLSYLLFWFSKNSKIFFTVRTKGLGTKGFLSQLAGDNLIVSKTNDENGSTCKVKISTVNVLFSIRFLFHK